MLIYKLFSEIHSEYWMSKKTIYCFSIATNTSCMEKSDIWSLKKKNARRKLFKTTIYFMLGHTSLNVIWSESKQINEKKNKCEYFYMTLNKSEIITKLILK